MSADSMNPVKDTVRTFNKYVLNPAMLHVAGRKHWYASVIRHTGRRTGKAYATPVVAELVAGDGMIIPLPYGTGVDWLRNLLSAGKATVIVAGQSYDVTEPEIIDAATAGPLLSRRRRRIFDRVGIAQYVRLRCANHRGSARPRR
jgi:deazaflavin-dependent oxidoreductase (nitroreductase family)